MHFSQVVNVSRFELEIQKNYCSYSTNRSGTQGFVSVTSGLGLLSSFHV